MKKTIIGLLIAVFLLSFGGAVLAEEKGKVDAETLFNQKCSVCHSIDRPKSKKKATDQWKSTVMRMKNVNGASITDEEAKIIIDYLSEKYGK